jgi:DNA-binding transcriptional MerR regulator
MDESIPEKTFFRIGEVSKLLNVQPYVVRYWESEFRSVRPVRTTSDQRLYRRRDVEELLTIKKLLYEENFTINGARKQLRKLHAADQAAKPASDSQDELLARIEEGLRQIRNLLS